MFVEDDLFGPDILTLNNMSYDKSTSGGSFYRFTWPISTNQNQVLLWVHDLNVVECRVLGG